MDFLMGLRGRDFVLVCSDTTATQQIITIKHDEDKLRPVDSHKVMAISGEPGDRVQFSEYIIANVKLYALRNAQNLTTDAVAHYTRNELATALRKRPYQTNLLLAGYDEGKGANLYWMDYLATMHKTNVAGTGYGSYFVLSMFDKLWHPNLEEQEAVELMVKGVEEVRRRLVVAPSSYQFKIVDANGIRDVTPAELRGHTQQGPTQMNIQQPPEVMVS
jgi:20S proteasome subunit beta 4